jgi:predicted DCC family thiol-disulfide oxidoreductase YuxK
VLRDTRTSGVAWSSMERAVLLFDEDCGFCRWAAIQVLRWDRRGALRALPIQSEEGDRLLDGMDDRRRLSSWHLASPDGRVDSAGAAVGPLTRLLPLGAPLALMAGVFPAATDALYRTLARHRTTLARVVGVRACAVDPTRRR